MNIKFYRPSECHKEEIKKQMNDLQENGIIRDSSSPFNSPIWVVPKKEDASGKKKWRIVIDFRKINEDTEQDEYHRRDFGSIRESNSILRPKARKLDFRACVDMKAEAKPRPSYHTRQGIQHFWTCVVYYFS